MRGSPREKVRDSRRASHTGTGEGSGFPEYVEATAPLPPPTPRHSAGHLFPLFWRWQEEPGLGVSLVREWEGQRPTWQLA